MNRYQLVAINNETNEEYVIPLKKGSKANKAPLGYIDSGVSRFTSDAHMAQYLYNKQSIPTTNVTFKIKYKANNKDYYLSPIYNDDDIKIVSKRAGNTLEIDDVFLEHEFNKLLIKLSKPGFYEFLLKKNKNPKNNGDCLNDKIINNIIEYFQEMEPNNILKISFNLENSFFKELRQYKQIRTLYMIMKEFDELTIQSVQESKLESTQLITDLPLIDLFLGESADDFKEFKSIMVKANLYDKLFKLYELGGMEAIYEIYDLDDIYDKDGVQLVLK